MHDKQLILGSEKDRRWHWQRECVLEKEKWERPALDPSVSATSIESVFGLCACVCVCVIYNLCIIVLAPAQTPDSIPHMRTHNRTLSLSIIRPMCVIMGHMMDIHAHTHSFSLLVSIFLSLLCLHHSVIPLPHCMPYCRCLSEQVQETVCMSSAWIHWFQTCWQNLCVCVLWGSEGIQEQVAKEWMRRKRRGGNWVWERKGLPT